MGRNYSSTARKRVKKSPVRNPRVLCEAYDYPRKVSFSRGVRVELNHMVMIFISGTASVDEQGRSVHIGNFTAQAQRVFANIAGLLESEGCNWHDVVRTTCYLTDFRNYDAFNDVRNRFYADQKLDPLPASTCIRAELCRPELLVEIEAIAIVPRACGNSLENERNCRSSSPHRAKRTKAQKPK